MAESIWSQIANNYPGVASPGAPGPGGYTGGVRGFSAQRYTQNRTAMWETVRPAWEQYVKQNRKAIKAALNAAKSFQNRQYPSYGSSPSSGGGGGSSSSSSSSSKPSLTEVSKYNVGDFVDVERLGAGPQRHGPPDDSGKWTFAQPVIGDNVNRWQYTG